MIKVKIKVLNNIFWSKRKKPQLRYEHSPRGEHSSHYMMNVLRLSLWHKRTGPTEKLQANTLSSEAGT